LLEKFVLEHPFNIYSLCLKFYKAKIFKRKIEQIGLKDMSQENPQIEGEKKYNVKWFQIIFFCLLQSNIIKKENFNFVQNEVTVRKSKNH